MIYYKMDINRILFAWVILMNCKIDLGGWNGIFAVPTDVVDKYMRIASGTSIKTLLYL